MMGSCDSGSVCTENSDRNVESIVDFIHFFFEKMAKMFNSTS